MKTVKGRLGPEHNTRDIRWLLLVSICNAKNNCLYTTVAGKEAKTLGFRTLFMGL